MNSVFFTRKGLKTLSIDLSPESVRLCEEKGLDAKVMSFDNLELPDNNLDSIWALNCLLHIPKKDLSYVLNEIKRVLKPGGQIFLTGILLEREDDFFAEFIEKSPLKVVRRIEKDEWVGYWLRSPEA